MTRTLTGLYDSYEDAVSVIKDLEADGIGEDDVSLLANRAGILHRDDIVAGNEAGVGAEAGATFGAIVGGATGLLAGLGMLAIPGIGPVVAAGWLVTAALGAAGGAIAGGAGGGLIGAMISNGVSEEDAHVYAESVRRGGCLVTARVPDAKVTSTQVIMAKYRQTDTHMRGQAYRETGWSAFDEHAPIYSEPEVMAPRDIYPTKSLSVETGPLPERVVGPPPPPPPATPFGPNGD
ncbi:MAG: hypothetical protein WCC64_14815 [Aliidongia sp.]